MCFLKQHFNPLSSMLHFVLNVKMVMPCLLKQQDYKFTCLCRYVIFMSHVAFHSISSSPLIFPHLWISTLCQVFHMLNGNYMNVENLYFSHKPSVSETLFGLWATVMFWPRARQKQSWNIWGSKQIKDKFVLFRSPNISYVSITYGLSFAKRLEETGFKWKIEIHVSWS